MATAPAPGLRPRRPRPRPRPPGGDGGGENIAPRAAAASGPFLRRMRSSSVNPDPEPPPPPDALRIDGGGDLRSEKMLRSAGEPLASAPPAASSPEWPRRDGYLPSPPSPSASPPPPPPPFIHGAAYPPVGLTISAGSRAPAEPSPSASRPRDSGGGNDRTSSSYADRSARVGAGDWRTMSSNLLCTCLASSPLSQPLDPGPPCGTRPPPPPPPPPP